MPASVVTHGTPWLTAVWRMSRPSPRASGPYGVLKTRSMPPSRMPRTIASSPSVTLPIRVTGTRLGLEPFDDVLIVGHARHDLYLLCFPFDLDLVVGFVGGDFAWEMEAAGPAAAHLSIVPTQLARALAAGVDLGRFRTVLVGGGPAPAELIARARAAGVAVVLSYGMTETCGGCILDGRPLDGVEVALAADGRIRMRGPMLATTRLGEDPATFAPDGWFTTSDLGRWEAGRLEVLGRADDVLITGGLKVDPAAIARVLAADPGVADVAVIGVADVEWGQRVRAVVVPTSGGEVSLAALRRRAGAALGAASAPRDLVIVADLGRDGVGKLTAARRA